MRKLVSAIFLWLFPFLWIHAQVVYDLRYDNNTATYTVSVESSTAFSGSLARISNSTQITLLFPHITDGFKIINLTNLQSGSMPLQWSFSRLDAPSENPTSDYLFFAPANAELYDPFDIPADTKIDLFSFQSGSGCIGDITLLDNDTDPLLSNSSLNPGHNFVVLGGGFFNQYGSNDNDRASCSSVEVGYCLTFDIATQSYVVSLKTGQTYTGGLSRLSSSTQASIVAPHVTGGFQITNLTDLQDGSMPLDWGVSRVDAPTENPTKDYLIFSPINARIYTVFDIPKDTLIQLFSFQSDSGCIGDLELFDNDNDPLNANVSLNPGNSIVIVGGGTSNLYQENICPVATCAVPKIVAVNDTITILEDMMETISVLVNDTVQFSEIDTAGMLIYTQPVSGGSASLTTAGMISYTPPANFNGPDTLSYIICETSISAQCDTAHVFLMITAVNDKPVATNDAATTNEETQISVDVQNNDSDLDNDPLTTSIIGNSTQGITPIVESNGQISYTPVKDFIGMDTITYRVCDTGSPSLCDTALAIVTVSPCDIFNNSGDCDGDGVTNNDELTGLDNDPVTNGDNTNPLDPCDLNLTDITLTPSDEFYDNDCDGDGVTNRNELIPPNGGTPTDPLDPCSFTVADMTLTPSSAFLSADCDGDGVTNGNELTPPGGATATDPHDLCDYIAADQIVSNVSAAWNTTDCDGDGVPNGTERTDSTDPLDHCSLLKSSQTLTPSNTWNALDCDEDGNPNNTDPNPTMAVAVDDAFTAGINSATSHNILTNDDFSAGSTTSIATVAGGTAAGSIAYDPTTGEITYTPATSETSGNVTVNYEVCNTAVTPAACATAEITITISSCDTSISGNDCDGDGVTNGDELTPPNGETATDPDDPCSFIVADMTLTPSSTFLSADCDGDGVTNGEELTPPGGEATTDPHDPCDYIVSDQIIANVNATWNAADCDGDGVPNGTEITNSTDPLDGCSLLKDSQTLPSSNTWNALDCDEDGNPNNTDPNPTMAVAVDDAFTAGVNSATSHNILTNDDFSAGSTTSIATIAGGTATGSIAYDPMTGEITYTPAMSETSGNVTVNYEVCNTATTPAVCATAEVTITISSCDTSISGNDCDGDGVTNGQEATDNTNPNDPCDLKVASVTLLANSTSDCDGDGVSNTDEINGLDGVLNSGDETDPTDVCDNPYNAAQLCTYVTANPNSPLASVDCDNGGIDNLTECQTDNTDPLVGADDKVNPNIVQATIQTSVWLEGAYSSNSMHTKLNDLGYLPGQKPIAFLGTATEAGQPYNIAPWNYNGIEGDSISIDGAAYSSTVTDWILVSLRSSTEASSTVCTQAGLLHSNGEIEIIQKNNPCNIDPSQSYYIVIEHRNHLIVMSDSPQQVNQTNITYDFRVQQSYKQLVGFGQKKIGSAYVMYAGNGNQDTTTEILNIVSGDKTDWLNHNGEHSSYYINDFDLNGDINVQDNSAWLINNGIFSDVPK